MVALIQASGGTGRNIMNANYTASSGLHETVSKDKTKREDDLIFKCAMEEISAVIHSSLTGCMSLREA